MKFDRWLRDPKRSVSSTRAINSPRHEVLIYLVDIDNVLCIVTFCLPSKKTIDPYRIQYPNPEKCTSTIEYVDVGEVFLAEKDWLVDGEEGP